MWLERLDHNATALLEHLSQRPTHRLGLYFEQLWHFFLQQDPDTDLVAHNLPVYHQGRTLGEFDCIYYCQRRNRHVHLELAVKFFLGIPRTGTGAGTLHEWLGPDRRDRLDLKLEQLLGQQILLGENPAAQQVLEERGIGRLLREVVLKGYLFQAETAVPPPPPGYNFECALSQWIASNRLGRHCALTEAEAYLILPKMRWLSPAHCSDSAELLTGDQLQRQVDRYFESESYPLLVAAMNRGEEIERFFRHARSLA